ncbi:MAG: hypothetical protein RR696_01865 [Clostridia bacterium]
MKRILLACMTMLCLSACAPAQQTMAPQGNESPSNLIAIVETPAPTQIQAATAATQTPEQKAAFKQLVQENVVTMFNANTNATLTANERETILKLFTDHGFQVSADWAKDLLENTNNENKADFLFSLLIWQFGDPAKWAVEEAYWYGELKVACGFLQENNYCLPAQGELTEAQARDYAIRLVQQKTELAEEWISHYDVNASFSKMQNTDGTERRTWWFEFYPIGEPWSEYYRVFFDATGENARVEIK